MRAEVLEGLRIVFGLKIIRAVTLAATIGALAGQMQAVVLVLYLVRQLGLSTVLVGRPRPGLHHRAVRDLHCMA